MSATFLKFNAQTFWPEMWEKYVWIYRTLLYLMFFMWLKCPLEHSPESQKNKVQSERIIIIMNLKRRCYYHSVSLVMAESEAPEAGLGSVVHSRENWFSMKAEWCGGTAGPLMSALCHLSLFLSLHHLCHCPFTFSLSSSHHSFFTFFSSYFTFLTILFYLPGLCTFSFFLPSCKGARRLSTVLNRS